MSDIAERNPHGDIQWHGGFAYLPETIRPIMITMALISAVLGLTEPNRLRSRPTNALREAFLRHPFGTPLRMS